MAGQRGFICDQVELYLLELTSSIRRDSDSVENEQLAGGEEGENKTPGLWNRGKPEL